MPPEPKSSASTVGEATLKRKDARMDTVMELEIGPGPEPGSYVVHVLRSVGGGEPTQTITLDLDELVARRPLLEATVLSSSVSARRVTSDTEAAVQDVGRRLFESTFSGEVRSAYRTSMAVASERGKGVQIALRLTAPGLAALPWEALFDSETGVYLCRKEPLVRHVPAPHSPAALAIEPPMRVLGMISSPRGLPALDVGGERERLEEALRPHLDSGRVELEWLDDVTWTGVHGKLLEDRWHVLHFVGHGSYDVETDEGVLAFVGRDGRADYVTASSLADLLDEAEPTPRLVVLNSCQTGAGGTTDLFSGTAAALAHSGIRAVAAMQFSISDVAAIEFARGFYTALAHGRGIDEAVRSGRIGILGMGRGTLEWVTPVLYLRGEDTQLFDVAPLPSVMPATTGPVAGPIPIVHIGPVPDATPHSLPPNVTASTPAPAPAPEPAASAPAPATEPADTSATSKPAVAQGPPRISAPASRPPSPPGASSEGPWWTGSPAKQPPAGLPPGPPRSRPASSAPASRPPTAARRPSTPRWIPWLLVGLVAVVAIAGASTVLSVLRLDPTGGTLIGESTDSLDRGPADGQATDAADPGVLVKEEVVSLTEYDWTYTGHSCVVGDEYLITASSEGAMHEGSPVGPMGLSDGESTETPPYDYALASLLIGVRGSDTLEFVGSEATFACPSASEIKLGVNDDTHLEGNSGQFRAKIWRISGQ